MRSRLFVSMLFGAAALCGCGGSDTASAPPASQAAAPEAEFVAETCDLETARRHLQFK